jgi:N,N'-diacetylchitobiose transport system permease protein
MSHRFTRKLGWNVLGLIVFAVMVFPVYWMVLTSFKTNDEINSSLKPGWIPKNPTLQNFSRVTHKAYFWTDVKNTVIVVLVAISVAVLFAFLAAVALEKYRFTGRKAFLVLLIAIQMLPGIGLIIPLYVLLAHVPVLHINLVNHLTGLIVVYISAVLPFSVWTLRGFLMGIPKELEEAAMVDGASRLGAFFRILLPLVAPGLVAVSVFAFIVSWNEYVFARLLLNDQSQQTITVWLANYIGGEKALDWGGLMAASTLIALPVVAFFLLVQRKIAFGLTAGAVRG